LWPGGCLMPAVKCGVDGCSRRLQPVLKPDVRDRGTWLYPECDVCFKPACEEHTSEIDGRVVCDRCRREAARKASAPVLIDLGMRLGPSQGGRPQG